MYICMYVCILYMYYIYIYIYIMIYLHHDDRRLFMFFDGLSIYLYIYIYIYITASEATMTHLGLLILVPASWYQFLWVGISHRLRDTSSRALRALSLGHPTDIVPHDAATWRWNFFKLCTASRPFTLVVEGSGWVELLKGTPRGATRFFFRNPGFFGGFEVTLLTFIKFFFTLVRVVVSAYGTYAERSA